jgi:predicted DNA-binding protein with PD1-like motif
MQVRQVDGERERVLLVERGEDLVRALLDECLDQGIESALVQGSGRATSIVLEGGPAGKRAVAGPLELLHVTGKVDQRGRRLAPELRVVACREMDTGLEMLGGVLLEAPVESAMLRVSGCSPMSAARVGPATGVGVKPWSAVAAASAELGEPPTGETGEMPRVGDVIDHPQFGQCAVVKLDDQHLRIRRREGRVVSLGLSVLRFSVKGQKSDGTRVFAVHVDPQR